MKFIKSSRVSFGAVLLFVFLQSLSSYALVTTCKQVFASPESGLPPKEVGVFRILQFNVEDLVHTGTDRETRRQFHEKPENKTREIVRLTEMYQPELAVWEEVENLTIMKETQNNFGMRGFDPYFLNGNDHFGIGMWLRKGLNFKVEYETHKDYEWSDPTQGGRMSPLFSRDIPAMIITKPGNSKPSLIVLGIHAKSKRDRDGDPMSSILRTAQFAGEQKIIAEYKAKYGEDVPLIAGGDHNIDVRVSDEINSLKKDMIDGFDAAPDSVAVNDRITHSFFPQGRAPEYQQLDAIMISRTSNLKPIRARVIPYQSGNGRAQPLPRNFKERKRQPSDHRGVILDIQWPE